MADGRHFEDRFLSEKSSDFDQIWYTTADIEPNDSHVTKNGSHLENHVFGHNSSTDCPISAKFCTRKQNGMSTRAR